MAVWLPAKFTTGKKKMWRNQLQQMEVVRYPSTPEFSE